jgi:hypothetical protein
MLDSTKIKTKIDSGTIEFSFPQNTIDYLIMKAEGLDQQILALPQEQQSKLQPFIIRFNLLGVKLSCHHAVLDDRTEIQQEHVEYAWERLAEIMNDLIEFSKKHVPLIPSYRSNRNEEKETQKSEILRITGAQERIFSEVESEAKASGIKDTNFSTLLGELVAENKLVRWKVGYKWYIRAVSQDLQNLQDPAPDTVPDIDATQNLQSLQN